MPSQPSLENVALITSPAIGDSLLLMEVAHNLRRHHTAVTVFGPHLYTLRNWFPGFDIQPGLAPGDAAGKLASFDAALQLHDHRPVPNFTRQHPRAQVLENLCRQRSPKSMAQRLAEYSRDELGLAGSGKYNGIVPPAGLLHRRYGLRVAIHPTASTPDKCWLPERFVALGQRLRKAGFDPQFIVSPTERPQWEHVLQLGLGLPDLGALDNVAAWIFESGWFIGNDSGLGHLASNLHVPTLSLFMRQGSARTWRPDWGPGRVLVGSQGIPTGRLKEKLWKYALTPARVERAFGQLRQTAAKNDALPWLSPAPATSAVAEPPPREARADGNSAQAPDVSVIVPVYNCAAYLQPLLASLQAQHGVDLEILAICDGATDDSLAILRAEAAIDPRIRVLEQPHRGVSASRNIGLELACGEWIAFADGDDWLAPRALQTWIEYGRRHGLDVVQGNAFPFEGQPDPSLAVPILARQPQVPWLSGRDWLVGAVRNSEWFVGVWVQCIRRDLIKRDRLRFEEGILHEDMVWTLQLALHAQRVGFVPQPFYGYRRNPESVTNAPSEQLVAHRAEGYLRGLEAVRNAARGTYRDGALRKSLLRQLNRDGGNFLHVVRKRLRTPCEQRRIAAQFVSAGFAADMLRGATTPSEAWRALRCWLILSRYARRGDA